MSDHHEADGLDRRTAERLIGGADDHARLHALLSAAAGPARPGELAGEDAAVAAFRAAPRPARTSRMAVLRRFLTLKALVLIGGSLVLSGGAAAYAAMNGHLPGYDPGPAPKPSPSIQNDTGEDQQTLPNTNMTPPSAPPTTGPPPSGTSSPSGASPGASTGSGRENAPGRQNQPTSTPRNTKQPPRGPGNNNGSGPGENSGNGNNGNGNGNGNNGSQPGQNSGRGNGNDAAD